MTIFDARRPTPDGEHPRHPTDCAAAHGRGLPLAADKWLVVGDEWLAASLVSHKNTLFRLQSIEIDFNRLKSKKVAAALHRFSDTATKNNTPTCRHVRICG